MIITNPIDVEIQEDDEFLMCSWHIHTEENSRIELFLLSLNLSERCDCCLNYITYDLIGMRVRIYLTLIEQKIISGMTLSQFSMEMSPEIIRKVGL